MKKRVLTSFAVIMLVLGFYTFPVSAYTNTDFKQTLSQNDTEYLKSEFNLNSSLRKLNDIEFKSTSTNKKVRELKLTNNLILEEELSINSIPLQTNYQYSMERASSTHFQVTSVVTIRTYLGTTAAKLTAIGYYYYNGVTCYADSADSASSSGSFYNCEDWVSFIDGVPTTGYSRVSCRYHISGQLGFDGFSATLSELNVLANVYCNPAGKYYSQWN